MENRIDELRDTHDLSQADLAEAVAVTRQTINAIERDRYDPSIDLVFKLAAYFECRVEDVFQPNIDVEETVSDG